MLSGTFVHEGAATGRQHHRGAVEQAGDHASFAVAEVSLAELIENLRDR